VRKDDIEAFLDAATELLMKEFHFELLESRRQAKANDGTRQRPNGATGVREKAYASAALDGRTEELAAAASGSRNDHLNKSAFRLGGMIARGWLKRADVEDALLGAMHANKAVADDGIDAAKATMASGLDAGVKEPHPDLNDQATADSTTANRVAEKEPIRPYTLAETHAVFQKWLGKEYDLGTLDAVLAVAAAEKLSGDPPWLLIISGPGNAKTETVQALSGLGA